MGRLSGAESSVRSEQALERVLDLTGRLDEIPAFDYDLLWQERTLCSVANFTRRDAEEFLALAAEIPIRTVVQPARLDEANDALAALSGGQVGGAAVLVTGAD